jgi:hypothetical protein
MRAAAPAHRHAARVLATALATAAALPAAAQTTAFVVDVQAALGYSTNPFLQDGDDSGAAFSEITIQPQLLYQDDVGDAALIGHYRRNDYFSRFGSTDSYGAEANAQRRLSPLVTLRGGLSYDSSILGQGTAGLVSVVDPTVVSPLPTTPLPGSPDIALLGLRERQETLGASIGAAWRLSTRDTVTTDVSANKLNYGADALTSSRTISGAIGYSRALSERTSVGLQGSASWVNFQRTGYSGTYYQPQLTLTRQVSPTISLNAAAGLLFVTSKTNLSTTRTTGFSGNLSACKQGDRSATCLRASSGAQPSGLGDVSRQQSIGVDYSYRVREHDTLRASLDYSRTQQTSPLLRLPNTSFVTGLAAYEHGFSRTIFGGISGGYRTVSGAGLDRRSDANVRIFVRSRWGEPK